VPAWIRIVVAGLSLGLLAITRPLTAVGVGLPFFLLGLYFLIQRKREIWKSLLMIGLIAGLLALVIPFWNAALTGDPLLNPYTLWWEYDRIGFGPGVGVTETGHNLTLAMWNIWWSLRSGIHDLFGWPYLSWIFLPFGLMALKGKREGWLLFSLFPALILAYMAYWVGAWLYGPRYYFEALPGLAIVSAIGILWLGGWLKEFGDGARIRRWVMGSLVLIMICFNILFYLPPRFGMMNQLNEVSRDHLVPFEGEDLGQAVVFVHVLNRWTEYGTLLTLTPPFADGDLILVYSRGEEANARVVAEFPGWNVYHYYADEPETFYREPRELIKPEE
jgi:hypothetical protein